MKLAIPTESAKDEPRVAATPETVKKFVGLGFQVTVQTGAGDGSRISDSQYADAGATLANSAIAVVKDADVVLRVRRPSLAETAKLKKGAVCHRHDGPHRR